MLNLLPELKTIIATKNQEAWFRMWKYDSDFRRRSETESGRKLFVQLFTKFEVSKSGTQVWTLFGKLHRENDLPAVVWLCGMKEWYKNDRRHRDNDLPAMVCFRVEEWWINGRLHRDNDLPAIIYIDGSKYWYQNNRLHRGNGRPAVDYNNGLKEWWENGIMVYP